MWLQFSPAYSLSSKHTSDITWRLWYEITVVYHDVSASNPWHVFFVCAGNTSIWIDSLVWSKVMWVKLDFLTTRVFLVFLNFCQRFEESIHPRALADRTATQRAVLFPIQRLIEWIKPFFSWARLFYNHMHQSREIFPSALVLLYTIHPFYLLILKWNFEWWHRGPRQMEGGGWWE